MAVKKTAGNKKGKEKQKGYFALCAPLYLSHKAGCFLESPEVKAERMI